MCGGNYYKSYTIQDHTRMCSLSCYSSPPTRSQNAPRYGPVFTSVLGKVSVFPLSRVTWGPTTERDRFRTGKKLSHSLGERKTCVKYIEPERCSPLVMFLVGGGVSSFFHLTNFFADLNTLSFRTTLFRARTVHQ